MAVTAQRQLTFWGIGLAILVLVLWFLGDTLVPFMLGAAIAYFLDPVADRLERAGLSRAAATALIAFGVTVTMALILLLVLPALIAQSRDLILAIPEAVGAVREFLAARLPGTVEGDGDGLLARGMEAVQGHLQEIGPQVLASALSSSMAVLDFVLLLVVAPVVSIYLLLDWDRMVARIDGWLPREHADTIRGLASRIDEALAGFVRGQFMVCMIQAAFYAIALTLIGLPFGFLIGALAGLLAFIPFVGAMVGGVLSIGVALFSFWGDWIWILATAAIFAFGQFVEGNILSPRLIGRSVGLHPVVLILALAVFGRLFGFAGLLVAVPAAAALGVLGRFAIERYLDSQLYSGTRPGGG